MTEKRRDRWPSPFTPIGPRPTPHVFLALVLSAWIRGLLGWSGLAAFVRGYSSKRDIAPLSRAAMSARCWLDSVTCSIDEVCSSTTALT